MPTKHQCGYCLTSWPTAQGIRSHISQSRECAKALKARNAPPGGVSEPTEENGMAVDELEDGVPEIRTPTIMMDVDEVQTDFDGEWNLDPSNPAAELEPPHGNTTSPNLPERRHRGVEMEEVEDEDDSDFRWVADYPFPVGSTKGECRTSFEKQRDQQRVEGCPPWAPFESQKEWELGRWLMTSGVSQKKMDSFLKLESVRIYRL